jgi:hypothetical protein
MFVQMLIGQVIPLIAAPPGVIVLIKRSQNAEKKTRIVQRKRDEDIESK